MRISVFGLGYVGSVSAACLAGAGHHVIGVDTSQPKVDAINAGSSPIAERGLEALIAAQRKAGRLSATTSSAEAIEKSDLALLCVGTPGRGSGQPDLWAIRRVAEQIGAALATRTGTFSVVLRSTVLPGTTESVLLPALAARANPALDLQVAVNPEFMREGCALQDFAHPAMTLVGCQRGGSAVLREVYASVDAPFVETAVRTAEMTKFASNSFHALKVCFANELAQICAGLGADAEEVSRVFLLDHKLNVSEAYLHPGFAFGGSCLPKDVRGLSYAARSVDVDAPLISSIIASNEAHQKRALTEILGLHKKKIGFLGVAFKVGTDDVRESPLLALIEALIGKGCDVRIFDASLEPASMTGANRRRFDENIPHIASLCASSLSTVVAHAEVLVIGHRSEAATWAIAHARPDQVVVDLTRVVPARVVDGHEVHGAVTPVLQPERAVAPTAQGERAATPMAQPERAVAP